MEIWQLRTFSAIAETLNFTKAAERLHLTQSAVSHQIKALEEEFGVQLFIRARGGVVLTDAGRVALEYAARILHEADEMTERVSGHAETLSGRVRVAAATQALVHLFAPCFETFMDDFEKIELVFRTTVSTEQTVDDILEGVADVGFASLAVYSPVLQVHELFEDELVLVVGRKHKFAGREIVGVRDIESEKLVLFERGASIRRATDAFFKNVGIKPEMALESNDTYFIKLMVEHGLGVSLMPTWAVRGEISAGKLAAVRIKGHHLKRAVSMLSLKGSHSAPIRAFVEFMMSQKSNLQTQATGGDQVGF